jgi:hypothetical protein
MSSCRRLSTSFCHPRDTYHEVDPVALDRMRQFSSEGLDAKIATNPSIGGMKEKRRIIIAKAIPVLQLVHQENPRNT